MTISDLKFKLGEAGAADSHIECAEHCRELLDEAVGYIFSKSDSPIPKKASLLELIDSQTVSLYVNDADIISSLHYVRILGMNAKYGRSVSKKEAKLALDNVTSLVGYIEAKENGNSTEYKKPQYMSEAATRRLYIDLYLKEAGWDVLDTKNLAQPGKAGIEIEVQGMPNGHEKGYCDYVLYGKDGRPLAIVEVKKTSVDPEKGRHQVDLYGECMKAVYGYKPILYYTNGYSTRIIDGIYPDREVIAFHSLSDLELMMQKRQRGSMTDFKVDDKITNRPYQKMAITSICEWLNAMHRRGLLVMATGTGKTRVAISLVDILSRNNWVKNVLFLADRTSLVSQAKRNFTKYMPSMSICELSGSGEKDMNARLMFCTYQTMINYIDAEDKQFSTGRFDLIIIDEAHRSIFNKYGSIFKYFDSFLIGLTATPKNEVDANTYKIFGCEAGIPNFEYSMEDAIKDKYLVGYHSINRISKLLSEGIRYAELSDYEKEQLEEYVDDDPADDPEYTISENEFFKNLFNESTCKKVLEDLMQMGLRVNGGETIGKTIIFAYNHRHAQMIVDCFHKMYPEYPANTCQLVDYSVSYAEDLVLKFDTDSEFRIAVSVDMLDTGIDVISVLNLVFFKKVRSKIKFIQMIGRGTRLCEDLFGPGKNKSGFYIFDYCRNFEYFDIHPDGADGAPQMTLSMRKFDVRIDMLYELQRLEYQQHEWLKEYYEKIKSELLGNIIKIKAHSERIQVREQMQYVDKYYDKNNWISLAQVSVREVKKHITPLVDSGSDGDFLSVSFDIRIYRIEKALLSTGTLQGATDDVRNVRLITQFLLQERASVPQVLAKAEELKTLRDDAFWADPTVQRLEKYREAVRDLMPFLQGRGKSKIDVDIDDEISDSGYDGGDTMIDIRSYKEKVIDYLTEHSDSPVIKKIYNLEPINSSDIDELERVLWNELGTKSEYESATDICNLAAFVRSLIGLSQEAVNEKFGEYLSGNTFNSQQQEFVKSIIDYVRENGDIELSDMVNTEPFSDFDINEMFGSYVPRIISIVNQLHDIVNIA